MAPGSPSEPPVGETRCAKLWFDDGTVILRAQNTVFRVYKGILARESSVFRDMFSLPQPEKDQGVCADSGCPVVEVQDDAEEMELFLSVIFNPRILYEECGMREHVILLGICSKYQTMLVLRRVVTTLQHFFPSTLSELDHSYNDCPDRCHTFPAGHPFRCSTLDNGDVRRLVQTARKAELHVLLPAAFLWLSVDEIPEILSEKYADWSRDELSTLLQGMLELDRIGRDDVFDALYSPQRDISDQCSNPAWCHDSRHAIIIDTQYWGYDKVMPFHTLDFEKSEAPQLCSACEDALKKSYLAGRATAWEQLPGVFGLPGWEELRKSASDALAVET